MLPILSTTQAHIPPPSPHICIGRYRFDRHRQVALPFIEGVTQVQHSSARGVAFAVLQGDSRAHNHVIRQASFDQRLQANARASAAASVRGQGSVRIDFKSCGVDLAEQLACRAAQRIQVAAVGF
ncbi:hypothetical protein D3C76_1378440 [compost metagenome]